jgi:hypothetical protein
MNAKARIKDELQKLIDDFEELGELCKNPNDLLLFGAKYQAWYTKALKIVGVLAADRLQEFKALYEASAKRKSLDAEAYSIQDFVRGLSPFMGDKLMFDTANAAQVRLHNQLQILGSLFSRIDGVLADVEGYLLSQLVYCVANTVTASQFCVSVTHARCGADYAHG